MGLTAEQIDWAAVSRDFAARFKSAEDAKKAVLEPWLPLIPPTCILTADGQLKPRLNKYIKMTPFPKQEEFLKLDCKEAFYGGAGFGGKSWALLAAALQFADQPNYNALIIRRTFKELNKPEAILDLAHKWLSDTDAKWKDEKNRYEFPSGATVTFGFMDTDRDKYQYTGVNWTYVAFDEVTQFKKQQYEFPFGWLRKSEGNPLPLRVRSASNPIGEGRLWTKEHFVDPYRRGDPNAPVFIPASIRDNPTANVAEYESSLSHLDPILRAQVMNGDWEAQAAGKFMRHWFKIAQVLPVQGVRFVRYWDCAATEPKEGNDPDYTVGALVGQYGREYFIADIQRQRISPHKVDQLIMQTAQTDRQNYGNVAIRMEQEPGSPIWEEEEVLMADGSIKPLKEIRVNDSIIDGYGQRRIVSKVHEQGELTVVTIKTESGRSVTAALEHPFLTPTGWIKAGLLKVGQSLGLTSRPEIQGVSSRIAEEFRLAGYFVGDGCCTYVADGSSIHAMITCSDMILKEDINHCAEVLGFKTRWAGSQHWHCKLSGGVRDWLRNVDLAGKRTETKVVPQWVFNAPNDLVAHFLGAYFATDGSIYYGNGLSIEFYGTSYALLHGVRHLLLRFGIPSVIRERVYRDKQFRERRQTMYRLEIRKSNDGQARFCEQIPVYGKKAGLLLDHAQTRERFFENHIADPIIEIVKQGETLPCRCLTVDGGHSFTVKDFAVHNSGVKVIADYTSFLAGYDFKGDKVTGPKEIRANALASQAEAGNVHMLAAHWNKDALDEFQLFPGGGHDDIVDACTGAFNELTGVPPINTKAIFMVGERLRPDW